jgi:hypothetical protein
MRKDSSGSLKSMKVNTRPMMISTVATPPISGVVTTPASTPKSSSAPNGFSPTANVSGAAKVVKMSTKPTVVNPPSPTKSASALAITTPPIPSNATTTTAECSSPSSTGDSVTSGATTSAMKSSTSEAEPPQRRSDHVVMDDQIKVAVRVRPMLPHDKDMDDRKSWEWDQNSIQLVEHDANIFNATTKTVKQAYQFDHLFAPEATNEEIYNKVVRGIVRAAMEGFHGSVFTYGQTSSGKTFTMNGDKNQPGIIPQAIAECFDAVNNWPGRDFILRVSYLEVYNEQIKDLLNMDPVPVRIQHDPKRGTVLTGVKEQVVLNTQQVLALIKSGEAHRHVGSTDMNEKSSRAHTLFKIIVESTSTCGKEAVRVSTLYLVDLAGSESAKMTNSKGERAREAKHINQSLLTLSTIIQRLSEDRHQAGASKDGSAPRKQHLPYRDSKLTRILESALDGNAQIGIVCTVSPTSKCVEETSNTLKFASRAKMIKMSAKVNETLDDKTLLRVYKEEIEQLRVRLQELESQTRANAAAALSSSSHGGNRPSIVRSESTSSVVSASASADGQRTTASEAEEEDANLMLQMIAEMERLILRADVTRSHPMQGIPRRSSGYGQLLDVVSPTGGGRRSLERKRSTGSSGEARSPRAERRRARESYGSNDANEGSPSTLAASSTDEVSLHAHGLRPKHLPPAGPPRNRPLKKKTYPSSSAALLSLIVEATDSDNLVRIDTFEESDDEIGTEPEGASDTDSLGVDDETPPNQAEDERAVPGVLEDIMTAEATEGAAESTAQANAAKEPSTVAALVRYFEEGASGKDNGAEERAPGSGAENDATEGSGPVPMVLPTGDDISTPTNSDPSPTKRIPDELRAPASVVVHSPKRPPATSPFSEDSSEKSPITPLSGEKAPSWFIPTTAPAATTGTTSPPPRALQKTSSGSRTLLKASQMQHPAHSTSIPRLSSFRGRTGAANRVPSLRTMSIDSEAGGDEFSVLSSYRGDSSWDEYDTAGEETALKLPPKRQLAPASATAIAQNAAAHKASPATSAAVSANTTATLPRPLPPLPPTPPPVPTPPTVTFASKLPDLMEDKVGFPPSVAAKMGHGQSPVVEWPTMVDSVEDDSVLLGVSKMLMILKGHVSKARSR